MEEFADFLVSADWLKRSDRAGRSRSQRRLISFESAVMSNHRYFTRSSLLSVLAVGLLCATGCVGPMACGPAGCNGPISLGGPPACGDGCNGCGERYYDEWINHPPRSNDPCDGCGNFNGQTCHACRPIFQGFLSIWGYRCEPLPTGCDRVACLPQCHTSGGCDSGCSSCASGHSGERYLPVPLETNGVEFGEPVRLHAHPEPNHGPSIVRPMNGVKPYQPQRSRQIFQPRGSVAGQPRGQAY